MDVTGLFGVTLSRVLIDAEKVELRDPLGRMVHAFLSPEAQEMTDPEDPEATGKAIMLTTRKTIVTVTDHSGAPLTVTFSHNHV